MMTLSDEEASRINNSKIKSEPQGFIRSALDENKQILTSWYFNGDKIQYSGKMNPAEDDWIDYTKSEFPVYTTFVQYKWRLKPEKPTPQKCRVALISLDGIKKPLLITDYDYAKVLITQECAEIFLKWLTDWIIWEDG